MLKNKSYSVKEWFANKVAQEVGHNISFCDVFGVLKETEKAAYVMLNLGCRSKKTMWIPKSVLVASEIGEGHAETYFFDSYEEASFEFKHYWNQFC